MGVRRFIHTLDVFGDDPPVIPFARDQVDASNDTVPVTT